MSKKRDIITPKQVTSWLKGMSSEEVITTLAAESPIENELSKRVICEAIAACRHQLLFLMDEQENGRLKADDARIIPGLASNVGRLLDKLETLKAPIERFDV
jgi:hypothetical protein